VAAPIFKTKTMAKVTVKALSEFFDRHNQTPRPEGSEFLLKDVAAKEYVKAGLVEEVETKEKVTKATKKEKAAQKHTAKKKTAGPDDMTTKNISKK
jgi:hypothetical protein